MKTKLKKAQLGGQAIAALESKKKAKPVKTVVKKKN
jgi:hypothetical protein